MSLTLFDLSSRVAVVTGASRGLGAVAAEALASAGAHLVLIGRHQSTLDERAIELRKHRVEALPLVCDMSQPDAIIDGVARIVERFGTIDILVNNAGIIRRSPAAEYSLDDWNDVLDVNLTAPFLMAREVGKRMLEKGSGKIINIASLLSFSGGLNVVAYTASKHGVAGLTRSLANEWGKGGIQVNAIAPGYFHTEATAAIQNNPERYEYLRARIPAGRWGEPDELRGTVIFLASPASDYINGHVLVVDGGWTAA